MSPVGIQRQRSLEAARRVLDLTRLVMAQALAEQVAGGLGIGGGCHGASAAIIGAGRRRGATATIRG